jgi:serine/threonine-protein kinase
MARPEADRNLLFGVIALEMDFVGRDALIAAMINWTLEKETPLGELLVRRGELAPPDRALLEVLVDRHVERHGGTAAESLASLGSVEWIRAELDPVVDPAQREGVSGLGTPDVDSLRTAARACGGMTSGGVRFRIIRPHARGGIGEVFVARDQELNRDVALKQIQERHADFPESRSRFVLEAEITGGLEHPGIVPVYGLGYDAAGRPFYAMRFIKGDSLKDAIDAFHRDAPAQEPGERNLALRALLGRFVAVCNAVAYAHSRGILHRDLKPSNIMLGKFGETMVVDWGMAKPVDRAGTDPDERTLRPAAASSSALTQAGSALGTPAFMSPEQAAGNTERMGPAADVYSLGATLYCLLTGKPPFGGSDLEALRRRVQQGDFPRPRAVVPDIPRPLEAICVQAMALSPDNRYPSPRALADDVEHWLADEPVSAWSEPFTVRARRWGARHRPLVAAAAAAVVVAAVCLGAMTVALEAANRRERAARKAADQSAREATRRRSEADANFRTALEAVDALTRAAQERLRDVPGAQPARRELLEKARSFYQSFIARGAGEQSAMSAELGRAHMRLASITNSIASTPEAVELARRGILLLERGADASELAAARTDLGLYLTKLRRSDEAEPVLKAAVSDWIRLQRATPKDALALASLARARQRLGGMYLEADRPVDALATLEAARADAVELVRTHPESPANRLVQAEVEDTLAQLYRKLGRMVPAETAHRAALEAIAVAARGASDDLELQSSLAAKHITLGAFYRGLGRVAAASRSTDEAIAILEPLVRDSPAVGGYRRALARAHLNAGGVALLIGNREQAAKEFETARSILDRLAAEQPQVPDWKNELAVALDSLSELHQGAGHPELAVPLVRKAAAIRSELARDFAGVAHFQHTLIFSQSATAYLAGAPAVQGIDGWRKLVKAHPEIVTYRIALAWQLNTSGARYQMAGRPTEAEAAYRDAIAIWTKLAQDSPEAPDHRENRARAESNLAGLLSTLGQYDRARPIARSAIATLEPLTAEYPDIVEYAISLGGTYGNLAAIEQGAGDNRAALDAAAKSIKLLRDGLARDAQNAKAKQFLGNGLRTHALVLARLGAHAEAIQELAPLASGASPPNLYDLACGYALASTAISHDATLADEDRERRAQDAQSRAFALLKQAQRDGLFRLPGTLANMKVDTDLQALRDRADFRAWMAALEQGATGQ